MESVEKRGVIVFIESKGEVNKRVGLYTEEGMIYFNLFGAKSAKGHSKSALGLFTMGRFTFSIGDKGLHKFVDTQVYNSCRGLASSLNGFYAASAAAELVRHTHGADHIIQFKLIVTLLRILSQRHEFALSASIIFLWRCLATNGWQPQIESCESALDSDINSMRMYYSFDEGFLAYRGHIQANSILLPYTLMRELQNNSLSFIELCGSVQSFEKSIRRKLIQVLYSIWNDMLGYKLILSDFMID